MKESTTYQAMAREERTEEARRLLLLLGETKFGERDETAQAQIEGIADLARLEELGIRVVIANTWEELFAQPARRRRNGRKSRG